MKIYSSKAFYRQVCELHFSTDNIQNTTESYDSTGRKVSVPLPSPRLRAGAIPEIFPGCPDYYTVFTSHREDPETRRQRIESANLADAIAESIREEKMYKEKYFFDNLDKLSACIKNVSFPCGWDTLVKAKSVLFIKLDLSNVPKLMASVVIDENLSVTVHYLEIRMNSLGKYKFPVKMDSVNDLIYVMQELDNLQHIENDLNSVSKIVSVINEHLTALKEKVESEKHVHLIELMHEQLLLLKCPKNQHRYSKNLLILMCLFYSISPHAYKFVRSSGSLIMPHPRTILKLCSMYNVNPKLEQGDNFLLYITKFMHLATENDKRVVLLMDEIHLQAFLDYKGGNVLGMAYNCDKAATSAYVFMIQSIRSPFKEVVHILPVKTLSADILFEILNKVIKGLESIGFYVVCISSDNNAINRKAVSYFSNPPMLQVVYQHPVDSTRPLFFVIDAVHLFKCIRNNWLNQKNYGKCMYYPDFSALSETDIKTPAVKTASLASLKQLYEIELSSVVKNAISLSEKALSPTNLERQNVKLALNLLNVKVAEGLCIIGEKHNIQHYKDTAEYIRIVCKWFDILNVRTFLKGKCKRDVFKEPLSFSADDKKIEFLNQFYDWLEIWGKIGCDTGFYSKETFLGLKHTTYAMIEIARYCTEELNMNYVLTAKFQTDFLEARFGHYRQLAGSHYNISLTQLYEGENKMRLRSLMSLTFNSNAYGKVPLSEFDDDFTVLSPKENVSLLNESIISKVSIKRIDLVNISDDLIPPLTYVAGYCAHSAVKKLKCQFCKTNLLLEQEMESDKMYDLIKRLDRGGLKYPKKEIVHIILCHYSTFCKIVSTDFEKEFLKVENQFNFCCSLTLKNLKSIKYDYPIDVCENGHVADYVTRLIVSAGTNIFLKNYCRKINNAVIQEKNAKKKSKNTTVVSKQEKRKFQTLL